MLQYLDDVLGRLFSFLESSPLGKNTYVMIMSDNGPQLLLDEKDQQEVCSIADQPPYSAYIRPSIQVCCRKDG
jgi:arylsulfatase A-like enzyme